MADVGTSGESRGADGQPKHGPWGHKDEDLLSNPEAADVFPSQQPIKAIPKPNQQESGVKR